jgi:uncharacterized protein YkwD
MTRFLLVVVLVPLVADQARAAGRARRGYWAPSYSAPSLVPGIPCLPPVHSFAPQGVIVYPTADQFVAVNNMLRAEVGLEPMQGDARLMAEAEQHAMRCRDRGCISHYHGGSVASRLASIGFDCSFCEDILAGGSPMLSRDPFAMWKASPDHFRTIIGNYTRCGFGVAYDSCGYGYWVGIYARE